MKFICETCLSLGSLERVSGSTNDESYLREENDTGARLLDRARSKKNDDRYATRSLCVAMSLLASKLRMALGFFKSPV